MADVYYLLIIYGGLFGAVFLLDRMAKRKEERERNCKCNCGKCHDNDDEE